MSLTRIFSTVLFLTISLTLLKSQDNKQIHNIDFKYSPAWWQTSINLPESSRKSIVGKTEN